MEAEAYHLMASLEAEHWWYRGRRALVRRLLDRWVTRPARTLEVGAGTGGNLEMLGEHGPVYGIEPSRLARDLSRARGPMVQGVADRLPFADATFDVVACLDVLEHLHDELAALDEIQRVLRRDGLVVLHVPAYQLLWGHEDEISRHLRRYRAGQIRRLLTAADLTPLHVGYAFTALLPVIAPVKIGKRLLFRSGPARSDVASLPATIVNDALSVLVEAEAEITATMELPFGASIAAVARKT